MKTLSIDIETYSDQNLAKTGVYRYVESPVFEILLFSYSVDGGPVQLVDLACGEKIPADIIAALEDNAVTKWAFNANFERVCLSRYLGYPTGEYLDPGSWKCSMVWAATMGLPLSLEGVGAVLGLEKQKLTDELSGVLTAMTAEGDIENLVRAKGFANCLAFIDTDRVTVTVSTGGASAAAGVSIPRTARDQVGAGQRIAMSELRPGDLVAYSSLTHVGMYIGDGKVVHAPRTGLNVSITSLSSFQIAVRVG